MTDQTTSKHDHPGDRDEAEVGRDQAAARETSVRPPEGVWAAFMALRDALGPMPEDFLVDRQQGTEKRDPLADSSAPERSEGRQP